MKLFCKVTCAILILVSAFGAFIEVNAINDVKDCKAYWEEVGEESTANLNKLEDGIGTLSENHDAYIDGKAQLAKGEEDYAAGVLKLENGRKELAAGIAKYNSGKKTLAATEKAFGGKGCPVLKQAYDGVNELKAGYSTSKAIATVAAKGGSDYNTVRKVYENVLGAMNKGMSSDQATTAVAKASVSAEVNSREGEIVAGVTEKVKEGVREEVVKQVEGYRPTIEAGVRETVEAQFAAQAKQANSESTEGTEGTEGEAVDEAKTPEVNVDEVVKRQTQAIIDGKVNEEVANQMSSEHVNGMINSLVAQQKEKLINENLPAAKAKVGAVYSNVKNLTRGKSQSEAEAMAASASGLSASEMHQAYNGYVQYREGAAQLAAASGQLNAGKQKALIQQSQHSRKEV